MKTGAYGAVTLQHEEVTADTRDMPRHWKGIAVVALVGLAAGALLVTRPWSGDDVPVASEYSSPSDLARDLNDHGLGCANPTRRPSAVSRSVGVPEPVVCSVQGRLVVVDVIPPALVEEFLRNFYPKRHLTSMQDLIDALSERGTCALRDVGVEAILVGPNWAVEGASEGDAIEALAAIRAEIGGTLLVADCSTATPFAVEVTQPWHGLLTREVNADHSRDRSAECRRMHGRESYAAV